ncbi:sulfate transporter 1.2-like [Vitis vinifera]|uniref:sulfate transporter 1.2-like n=1 Tax=Vitis vinifera TaxID=29760 RepID=UPI002882EAB1|nr:sulfate transporter 1.2-like [Vitis vinifera]
MVGGVTIQLHPPRPKASNVAEVIKPQKLSSKNVYIEAVAIGRTFASMKDYQLDGNKEMVALGAMNIVGSMTSCYVATSDVRMVSISFAKILLQFTRPRTAILGRLPRTTVYRNIQQYPEATKIPGLLIVRVDSAIYFSNSIYVKERILRWLTDEEEQLKEANLPRVQFLIVEMSPVTDIDTSGIHALEELHRSLLKRDVKENTSTLIALYVSKNLLCKKLNTQNHITFSLETIHVYYILYELRDYLIESSQLLCIWFWQILGKW